MTPVVEGAEAPPGDPVDAPGQIDDVQMSLFAAVHGAGSDRPPYADAGYYGEITHPTERLIDLLTEIAIRIGGGDDYLKARAVTRLDQGMGGGKSHACIGAFHLAAQPRGAAGHRARAAGRCSGEGQDRLDRSRPATCSTPARRRAAVRQHDARRARPGARRAGGQPLRTVPVAAVLQGLHALRALPAATGATSTRSPRRSGR